MFTLHEINLFNAYSSEDLIAQEYIFGPLGGCSILRVPTECYWNSNGMQSVKRRRKSNLTFCSEASIEQFSNQNSQQTFGFKFRRGPVQFGTQKNGSLIDRMTGGKWLGKIRREWFSGYWSADCADKNQFREPFLRNPVSTSGSRELARRDRIFADREISLNAASQRKLCCLSAAQPGT